MPPLKTISDLAGSPQEGADSVETQRWSLLTRIAFRFALVFFPLFNAWTMLLNNSVGSRDTTANYVQLLCCLVTAALVTAVWSVLDRRRRNYQRLNEWFRLYLRMVLAAIMISYGAAKLFAALMPEPNLSTLLEHAGDSSPMHMLWTLMGASPIYSFFAGAVEVLGGVLLVIPQLTLLGALVTAAAATNVLMLNLGYDVPAKIFAINLVLMAVLLLLPDLRRLADVFVLEREAQPRQPPALFRRRSQNRLALALQLLFGLGLLTAGLYQRHRAAGAIVAFRHSTPLYGIWTVQEFTADGAVLPPLVTDNFRWHRLIVDAPGSAMVQSMRDAQHAFTAELDPGSQVLTLKRQGEAWQADFLYTRPAADELTLQGQLDGRTVAMKLHRSDQSQFLLLNRGFHWITEVPVNR